MRFLINPDRPMDQACVETIAALDALQRDRMGVASGAGVACNISMLSTVCEIFPISYI